MNYSNQVIEKFKFMEKLFDEGTYVDEQEVYVAAAQKFGGDACNMKDLYENVSGN